MKMSDPHFGVICLCALRYAIGRETYMPSIVQEFIRSRINYIDRSIIAQMIREINEHDKITDHVLPNGSVMKIDGLGSTTIDRPGWEKLRAFLEDALREKVVHEVNIIDS